MNDIIELGFNPDRFGINSGVFSQYLETLENHIRYVRAAGVTIGVPVEQLIAHDASKFTIEEFPHYARHFFGDKQRPELFTRAWLNHLHNNPHHWQYWILGQGYKGEGTVNGMYKMPDRYALEMVADWMGAGMAYTGSWDMSQWLVENMPRIMLHPETAVFVRDKLNGLGYEEKIAAVPFFFEVADSGQ